MNIVESTFNTKNVNLIKKLFPLEELDIEKQDKLYISGENNKNTGFIHVSTSEKYGLIKGLGVLNNYRNKGIGKKLLIKGLNHLYFDVNVSLVLLKVKNNNDIAISFYKDNGFKIVKEYDDSYLMMRPIC